MLKLHGYKGYRVTLLSIMAGYTKERQVFKSFGARRMGVPQRRPKGRRAEGPKGRRKSASGQNKTGEMPVVGPRKLHAGELAIRAARDAHLILRLHLQHGIVVPQVHHLAGLSDTTPGLNRFAFGFVQAHWVALRQGQGSDRV